MILSNRSLAHQCSKSASYRLSIPVAHTRVQNLVAAQQANSPANRGLPRQDLQRCCVASGDPEQFDVDATQPSDASSSLGPRDDDVRTS